MDCVIMFGEPTLHSKRRWIVRDGRLVVAWLMLASLAAGGCCEAPDSKNYRGAHEALVAMAPDEALPSETGAAGADDRAALKLDAAAGRSATPVSDAGAAVDKRSLIREAVLVIAVANP